MSCRVLFVCLCVFSLTIFGGCKGSGSDSSGGNSNSSQSASVGKSPGGPSDGAGGPSDGESNSRPASSGGYKPSTGTNDTASKSDPDQADPDQADPDQADPDQADGSNAGSSLHAADHITDVKVRNYGSRTDGVTNVTFGQVFADGAVSKQQSVVAVADGKVLPTQVDRKATWSNGSLRHAIITVQLNAPGPKSSRSLALYMVDNAADSGFDTLKLGDLLGTNFSAEIKVTRAGTTYTANARRALERVAQTGKCPSWGQPSCKRWLKGSLASEWIVSARLTDGNKTAPRLRVYFNVRAYRGPGGAVANVRVDTVVENDLAYADRPNNVSYSARIEVGGNQYTVDDLTHYVQARWHKVLWWHGNPDVYAKLDMNYFQSTRAVSRYAKLSPSRGFLNGLSQSFAPMAHGNQTPHMGQTGAQATIGPLPRWTSVYVVSGDRRAYGWMLANDDAVGSYGFHYRDDATGRPLKITDHPYVTIAAIDFARRASDKYKDDALPRCDSDCDSPYKFDISHHPSIGYVAYLVTGDYYYLEEMQFAASYDELWSNPGYRNYSKGKLTHAQRQVRGQAWALRSITDAAFATPDNDPMKSYFVTLVKNIFKDYNSKYTDQPAAHPLHVLDDKGAVVYGVGQPRVGIAPWQQDFFTWAVGHAAEQGFPGAEKFLKWLSVFQVGMMTEWQKAPDTGFCWLQASDYKLRIRDSKGSAQYPNLNMAYKATNKNVFGLTCNSQEMVNAMSDSTHTYKIGEMHGYAYSATGFPSNFQIALAMAADSGIDNATEAWKIFAGRAVKPDYRNYPNFAVIPR